MNTIDVDRRLLAAARERTTGGGPAHDFGHALRVARLGEQIALAEGARAATVVTAALLHEIVSLPKDHPDSRRSGEVCALAAADVLRALAYPPEEIDAVAACIRDHPYSLGVTPALLEGRVLQDADRLDAIGATGIARCFSTSGELRRELFHPDDPFCRNRTPDDRRYGLDHFYRKLLRITESLHTDTARRLARRRVAFMEAYLHELELELRRGE